jgi:hypothetical protein
MKRGEVGKKAEERTPPANNASLSRPAKREIGVAERKKPIVAP